MRPAGGLLLLHTMHFQGELVTDRDLDLSAPKKKPSKREVQMAGTLVDSLHDDFDISKFKDTHRRAVMKVIRDKAEGREIEPPAPAPSPDPDDLMASLEAAVKAKA